MPPTVVIGLLGTVLDRGKETSRWDHWRPTVDLCRHEDLLIDRLELLYPRKQAKLAKLVHADIGKVSPETEVRRHEVDFRDPWDFEEVYARLHDFARAYPFRTEDEDYLVHITTGTHVAQICLFLLAEAKYLPARLVQTSPPDRRERLAPGKHRIIDLDLSKYDRLASRFSEERHEGVSFLKSGIETRNDAFNRLMERIERVAIATTAPILLTGPTGAGKSMLARRIYELKRQRRQVEGPFVEVNCATLRGDAAMSAMFGHAKGAFTGAVQARPGLLRTADGGILFLDEIGELGLDEQAMLLRAIEEKVFLPVGTDREVSSDFQLLAGSNRDLDDAVREGRFREDLLARIDLWTFRMPGLAERVEDIEPNLEYELAEWERREGSRVRLNREARARFLRFASSPEAEWRGNFRDFNAAVTRMATLSPGGRIDEEAVEEEIGRLRAGWRRRDERGRDLVERAIGPDAAGRLDRFDRVQLGDVLDVCLTSPSLSDAGRRLFAVSREKRKVVNDADRLRKYLARFKISWSSLRESVTGGHGRRS